MDWSNAKNLLIVIFLVLNIFLFSLIGITYFDSSVSKETLANTEKILESSGVTLESSIPNRIVNDIMLTYAPSEFDRLAIARKFFGEGYKPDEGIKIEKELVNGTRVLIFTGENSFKYEDKSPVEDIDVNAKREVLKYVRSFAQNLGFDMSDYTLDVYEELTDGSKGIHMVYREKFKSYVVFDSYIKIDLGAKGITALECVQRKPVKLTYREKKIIPAHAILLKNYTEGSTTGIKNIDLGFKCYTDDGKTASKYEYLTWRVTLSTDEEQYFKASDGMRITE